MKKVILAAATGLALCSAAACSSSTSNGSGGTAGATSAAPHTRVASVAGASATPSLPTVIATGSDKNPWCAELAASGEAVIDVSDPSALPPDWKQKAEKIAADAPSEIRSDVQTMIKGDEKIINGDPNGDSTQEFLTAGQHVVAWLTTNCPATMRKFNPGLGSSTP